MKSESGDGIQVLLLVGIVRWSTINTVVFSGHEASDTVSKRFGDQSGK